MHIFYAGDWSLLDVWQCGFSRLLVSVQNDSKALVGVLELHSHHGSNHTLDACDMCLDSVHRCCHSSMRVEFDVVSNCYELPIYCINQVFS